MRSVIKITTWIGVLWCFPLVAHSQIYKCLNAANKVVYQDAPCGDGVAQDSMDVSEPHIYTSKKKNEWTSRMYAEKPSGVFINSIRNMDSEPRIIYEVIDRKSAIAFNKLLEEITGRKVWKLEFDKVDRYLFRASVEIVDTEVYDERQEAALHARQQGRGEEQHKEQYKRQNKDQ